MNRSTHAIPRTTGPYKQEDINVFMEPLVQELKDLFERGRPCYDAVQKERFCLKAIMLWTIHDWPGMGMI